MLTAAAAQAIRAENDADREPKRPISARGPFRALALVAADANVRRLALSSFFFSALQLCLTTYLVTYLTNKLGYTLVEAGLMLAVATTAGKSRPNSRLFANMPM